MKQNSHRSFLSSRQWIVAALIAVAISLAGMLTINVIKTLAPVSTEHMRKVDIEGYAPGPVEMVSLPMGTTKLPYQRLFEAISAPGESLDAFVLRIAPVLRAYTDETGFEACGALAAGNDRFGVVVGSNHGHTACAVFNAKRPAGMLPLDKTLHSHPRRALYRVNQTDMLLSRANFRRGQVRKGSQPDRFSLFDYETPGYLVGAEAVYHQLGHDTDRVVGLLTAR